MRLMGYWFLYILHYWRYFGPSHMSWGVLKIKVEGLGRTLYLLSAGTHAVTISSVIGIKSWYPYCNFISTAGSVQTQEATHGRYGSHGQEKIPERSLETSKDDWLPVPVCFSYSEPTSVVMFLSAFLYSYSPGLSEAMAQKQPGHDLHCGGIAFGCFSDMRLQFLPVTYIIKFQDKFLTGEWKDTALFQSTFVRDFQIQWVWSPVLAQRACWPPVRSQRTNPCMLRSWVHFEKELESLTPR